MDRQAALLLLHPGDNGNHIACDLLPEGGDLLGAVAVAAQPVVAQGDIAVIPHGPALGGAVLDQLAVEPVQLILVPVKPAALGLKGAAWSGAPIVVHHCAALGQPCLLFVVGRHGPVFEILAQPVHRRLMQL